MIACLLECIRMCLFISHYSYDSFLDVAKLVLDNCYHDECTPETKLEFVEDFDYGYALPINITLMLTHTNMNSDFLHILEVKIKLMGNQVGDPSPVEEKTM